MSRPTVIVKGEVLANDGNSMPCMSFSVHSPSSYSALDHSSGGRCGSGGTNDANPGGCMTPAVEDGQGEEVGSRPPGLAFGEAEDNKV